MNTKLGLTHPGVLAALGAALLFGAGTPLAKLLLQTVNPWLLAGLLYLGSGLGMAVIRRARRAAPVRLSRAEWPWLAGAIAAGASLLLNAEGVFTALLGLEHTRLERFERFEGRIVGGLLIALGLIVMALET